MEKPHLYTDPKSAQIGHTLNYTHTNHNIDKYAHRKNYLSDKHTFHITKYQTIFSYANILSSNIIFFYKNRN